jgi:hypothetical protein
LTVGPRTRSPWRATADGAVLFGGWMCGATEIGEDKIASPGHSALFFLAKLAPGSGC